MNFDYKNSFSIVPYLHKESDPKFHCLASDDRMQRLVELSFKAQFSDHAHFRQYGMGDVVVLVGTSTAGKTSIIKALQQFESDRLEDGDDLRGDKISLNAMKKFNPREVEFLLKVLKNPLDIPKAMCSLERSWIEGVSPEEKEQAEAAIQRMHKTGDSFSSEETKELRAAVQNLELEMFDEAFESSRKGINVICDALNIHALARVKLVRNFDGPLRIVLTYCPFHILSSRMAKRNQEAAQSGAFSNQRIGAFPLIQFSQLYSQKKEWQVALETLTRLQAIQAFDENFDKGVEADRLEGRKLPSSQQLAKEKMHLREQFLANLGFKEGVDEIEVAPVHPEFFTDIIDSNLSLSRDSAQRIHNGTHQRYRK